MTVLSDALNVLAWSHLYYDLNGSRYLCLIDCTFNNVNACKRITQYKKKKQLWVAAMLALPTITILIHARHGR